MNSTFLKILAVAFGLLILSSAEADAFRTYDGKLITPGLSRGKVIAVLGQPQSQHTETVGLTTERSSEDASEGGRTVDTWIYFTKGSHGQDYIVTLKLESGKVISVVAETLR